MYESLVSIIMPSYNTTSYILETIESVQKQTYSNWELIIVDDNSTDNIAEVMDNVKDDRIIFISKKINQGAALARNEAIRNAKGKYIAFLDSDDLWHKEKLRKQVQFMSENDYAFTYTLYEHVDENSNPTGVLVSAPKKVRRNGFNLYCWCGCLTAMYDAEKLGLIQVEDLKKRNDYAVWLKINNKYPGYLLPEVLAYYRKRENSLSNVRATKLVKYHYTLFRVGQGKGIFMSFLYTGLNIVFGVYKKIRYVSKI